MFRFFVSLNLDPLKKTLDIYRRWESNLHEERYLAKKQFFRSRVRVMQTQYNRVPLPNKTKRRVAGRTRPDPIVSPRLEERHGQWHVFTFDPFYKLKPLVSLSFPPTTISIIFQKTFLMMPWLELLLINLNITRKHTLSMTASNRYSNTWYVLFSSPSLISSTLFLKLSLICLGLLVFYPRDFTAFAFHTIDYPFVVFHNSIDK